MPGRIAPDELALSLAAPARREGFESVWLTVDGRPTHYRVHERAPAAVPMVLVHGLAVSHRYLMPTARALAADHPVYVPDLIGFGLSDKPRAVWDVRRHARHLAAWLDRLDLPAACVIGNSFGAEVAAELAARYPSAVAALVLVGPTADSAARSRTGLVRRFLLDLTREDPRQARILARDVRDAGPRRVFVTVGHSVRNRIEATLSGVEAPVLLARGSRDPIAPADWLVRLARRRAGTLTAELPGAAHNALTTAGPQAATLVRGFLAGATR